MLVLFIVLFPIATLSVFAWLVAFHHTKLYSPSDFKSDEAFERAQAPPKSLGQRLKTEDTEASASEAADTPSKAPHEEVGGYVDKATLTPPQASPVVSPSILNAYLAEGLVFQEFQSRLGGSIRKEVRFQSEDGILMVDGIIDAKPVPVIVEVKFVRTLKSLPRQVGSGKSFLKTAQQFMRGSDRSYRYVLAVVIGSGLSLKEAEEAVKDIMQDVPSGIDYSVMSFGNLVEKYGLSNSEQ